MQMGGADQWGNITAGLELIRRTVGRRRGRAPRTGSRTSCCCRRRARSSARARAAIGVARPGPDVALRVLPVLAQRRRPRRRARTCAGSRCSSATRSRRWMPRSASRPGAARGAAAARVRRHGAGPRRGGGARGRAPGPRRRSRRISRRCPWTTSQRCASRCRTSWWTARPSAMRCPSRSRPARTRRRARRGGRWRTAAST